MEDIIKAEFKKRMYSESYQRIVKCAGILSEEELWKRPNANLVSVANLILHLSGNIRQWIGSGVHGLPDIRIRDKEFEITSGISRTQLLDHLEKVVLESIEIVNGLQADQYVEKRKVQGFDETVLSIIIHVVEHMSYHTGQITFYTKLLKQIDTGYYSEMDLNVK